MMGDVPAPEPGVVVAALRRAGATVAVAESLTGGLVTAALTSVPGASAVIRGGVVAYATELKTTLAAVPHEILDRDGPVARSTAAAMARGVRTVCDAAYGVATTGVAGPDSQDGKPPGTVYVAVASDSAVRVDSRRPDGDVGDRDAVRQRAVDMALALLIEIVEDDAGHIRES